jgi:hypothetical protein
MLNSRDRRKQARRDELVELIAEYGPGRTARLLEVHDCTVKRWAEGKNDAPMAVIIALRAAVHNQVPDMHRKDWVGWRFGTEGHLFAPGSNRGYTPGGILSFHFKDQLISHLKRKVKELEERALGRTASDQAGQHTATALNPLGQLPRSATPVASVELPAQRRVLEAVESEVVAEVGYRAQSRAA